MKEETKAGTDVQNWKKKKKVGSKINKKERKMK